MNFFDSLYRAFSSLKIMIFVFFVNLRDDIALEVFELIISEIKDDFLNEFSSFTSFELSAKNTRLSLKVKLKKMTNRAETSFTMMFCVFCNTSRNRASIELILKVIMKRVRSTYRADFEGGYEACTKVILKVVIRTRGPERLGPARGQSDHQGRWWGARGQSVSREEKNSYHIWATIICLRLIVYYFVYLLFLFVIFRLFDFRFSNFEFCP